jgi:protein-S-isoprenylcysteine O-methyltransferase Ste14
LATFFAQVAMGSSWRVGVKASEKTSLVTTGPFAWVRNPIYTSALATVLGVALLLPTLTTIFGLGALFFTLEVQTRKVEEPYLLRMHGDEYRRYAERVGRFLPWFGRLT